MLFSNNVLRGGDNTLVLKKADTVTVIGNDITGGSLNAVLLKGCTNCVIEQNRVLATACPALANYDGDAAYTASGNTVRRNRFTARGTASLYYWLADGDAGSNAVDLNTYEVAAGGLWGSVRGKTCRSLADVRAAWVGYSVPNNDGASVDGQTRRRRLAAAR